MFDASGILRVGHDGMKTILVIDDSPSVREHVCQALDSGGYHTLQAADGVAGLASLQEHADIALVLCDVNMPHMSGLDLLDELSKTGRLRSVPFVLLTTQGQPSLIERAKKAGAKGWIVKPFKPALLLAAARKLLGD